jgi:integrase
MPTKQDPNGSQLAPQFRLSSKSSSTVTSYLQTLGDVMDIVQGMKHSYNMLGKACELLSQDLAIPANQIALSMLDERCMESFRSFLRELDYKPNSVNTLVKQIQFLLNTAKRSGWTPTYNLPPVWQEILTQGKAIHCVTLIKHLARFRPRPEDVTVKDVDDWVNMRGKRNSDSHARMNRSSFWHLLHKLARTTQRPDCLVRAEHYYYGMNPVNFDPQFLQETSGLIAWKTRSRGRGRNKGARHRRVSADSLMSVIRRMVGFATNIHPAKAIITSLRQLSDRSLVEDYIDWMIDVREVKGQSVLSDLALLFAALRQWQPISDHILIEAPWEREVLDSIPVDPKSVRDDRKARRCCHHSILQEIPGRLLQERIAVEKELEQTERTFRRIAAGTALNVRQMTVLRRLGVQVASLAMHRLLISWLLYLPWRSRNLRECVIGKNLINERIPPFVGITKRDWVVEEEARNPNATFWMFKFSPEETKKENFIRCVLPQALIEILEEYLAKYRPLLVDQIDPGTLFLNQAGNAMSITCMALTVASVTLKYGGQRITPHAFRHIAAYRWLEESPGSYLELSKMLWHSSVDVTIRIYGSEYNESNGHACFEDLIEQDLNRTTHPEQGQPLSNITRYHQQKAPTGGAISRF